MKKKIMAMCLVIAMAATAVIGGTLAYFTDTDADTNVFTFGNVSIFQNEQQRIIDKENDDNSTQTEKQHSSIVNNAKLEDFEDNKVVYPAILKKLAKSEIDVNGYKFDIRGLEGNYMDKIVSVTNTGTEKAYMRTIIAVPSMNGFDDDPDATDNPLHWNYLDSTDFEGGWDWNGSKDAESTAQREYLQNVLIGGVEYDIYVATHTDPVEAGKTTSPSMVGFYLHDTVDYGKHTVTVGNDEVEKDGYFFVDKDGVTQSLVDYMKVGNDGKVTLKFLVATEACQTEGFADAWEALDTAFGKVEEYKAADFAKLFANN